MFKLMMGAEVEKDVPREQLRFKSIRGNAFIALKLRMEAGSELAFELIKQVPFEPLPDFLPELTLVCRGWAFTSQVCDFLRESQREGKIELPPDYWLNMLKHGNHAGRLFSLTYLREHWEEYPNLEQLITDHLLLTAPDEHHKWCAQEEIEWLQELKQEAEEKKAAT